eukprot:12255_1
MAEGDQSSKRSIIIHLSESSYTFTFFVSCNLSELDNEIYNNLINEIKSNFNLYNSHFTLYEDVGGKHMNIEDWDDLSECLSHATDSLHLYVVSNIHNPTDDVEIKQDHRMILNTPNGFDDILCNATDDIEIDSDYNDEDDNDEKKMENALCEDELYKWCTKFGFEKYYKKFIYDFGIESLDEILESSIDDLLDVCHDLKFAAEEKQKFLSAVISNNENNELKIWCDTYKLTKIYKLLIENGYFSTQQLSKLTKNEQINLCKKINIKFGTKTRFLNNIPHGKMNNMVQEREIISIKSDEMHNNNDMMQNRTILMVGETGTGKTTTINSMMNYLYDAQFNGNRYQLIYEQFDDKKETDSQTSKVSVYYLTPTTIDYTLTIIDTPGFGNVGKQGIEFDQIIVKQLKTLFETDVTEIDGICFVVKASQNKLTERQKYVFREVINIFGKNVANNIILLFTYSDHSIPNGLAAVNNNNPKIPHRDKYFKYNNDAFTFDNNIIETKRIQWNKGMETFGDFFEEITKLETQSLQLSKQVLDCRNSLKHAIKDFQIQLKHGLTVYQGIMQRISAFSQNKDIIDKNDEKMIKIQVPRSKKVIKQKPAKWFVKSGGKKEQNQTSNARDDIECEDALQTFLVCNQHKLTCIDSYILLPYCPYPDCNQKSIFKAKYKYELVLTKVTVPIRKLNSGYLDATLNQRRSDRLLIKEKIQLQQAEHSLCELIVKIRKCINKIKELALNTNSLKTNDYFDILIEREIESCENGWKTRVNALQSLQKQQELI